MIKLFPIVSRAFWGAIENGSVKKERDCKLKKEDLNSYKKIVLSTLNNASLGCQKDKMIGK